VVREGPGEMQRRYVVRLTKRTLMILRIIGKEQISEDGPPISVTGRGVSFHIPTFTEFAMMTVIYFSVHISFFV
jgi:hypothetical protein